MENISKMGKWRLIGRCQFGGVGKGWGSRVFKELSLDCGSGEEEGHGAKVGFLIRSNEKKVR